MLYPFRDLLLRCADHHEDVDEVVSLMQILLKVFKVLVAVVALLSRALLVHGSGPLVVFDLFHILML